MQASAQEKPRRSPEESQIKLTFSRLSHPSNYRSSSNRQSLNKRKEKRKCHFKCCWRARFFFFTPGLLLHRFSSFRSGPADNSKVAQPKSKPNDHHRTSSLSSIVALFLYYRSLLQPAAGPECIHKNTEAAERERESQIQFRVCVCVGRAGAHGPLLRLGAGGVIWPTKSINPAKAAGSCSGQPIFADTRSLFYMPPFPGSSQPIPAGFPTQ